jgi:hypothetical protein
VQSDLLGLEFTKGELRRLTGVDPDDVFRASILQSREKRLSFLLNEILICFALSPIVVGFIYTFIVFPTIGSSIEIAIALLIVVAIAVAAGRWLWRKKTCPKALTALLDDVDKYQAVIKAIDINEQLETDGTALVSLSDRTLVIEALQLTREDLVRALKAERILRYNKDALAKNPSLFTNNLSALRAMQVSSQASEYGRMLNEALQIGLSVQQEMRKLQGQRSS